MRDAVAAALGTPVTALRPVAGGDLNDAWCATLADGSRAFVKASPNGGFAAEATGLAWLADGGGLRTPEVLAVEDGFLVLEWVDTGALDAERLGRGLALTHRAAAGGWGDAPVTPIPLGPLALEAAPAPDAASWLVEQRWWPLARAADARGALPPGTLHTLERVDAAALLPDDDVPARLHGDLWTGNVLGRAADGEPLLIDPAAHVGPREVDLAMLQLFGAPAAPFFAAYEEVWPLPDGWRERVELHQLTPLLVHAVLFGGGYGARAGAVIARYAT